MWPQVIDLFSSKQAGIAGMTVFFLSRLSFSIARGIARAWAEGQTKTNIVQKNVHTLFFLVVGDCRY